MLNIGWNLDNKLVKTIGNLVKIQFVIENKPSKSCNFEREVYLLIVKKVFTCKQKIKQGISKRFQMKNF